MNYFTLISGVKDSKKGTFLGILKVVYPILGSIIEFPTKNSNFKSYNLKIEETLNLYSSLTITTRLSGYFIKHHLKNARKKGYYIQLFYLTSDDGMTFYSARDKKRFESRLVQLKRLMPYCDKVVFFDTSKKIQQVGEYHHGFLYSRGNLSPQWFKELLEMCNF